MSGPRALGFDPDRLRRIDRFLDERYVAPGRLAGVALVIGRDGQVAHETVQGRARADGTPLKVDAIYRIASMTKPITSLALMMLVEEGRIALDDPVTTVLPEWKDIGVYEAGGGAAPFTARPPSRPMLVVDLLRHTAGLTYGFQNRTNIDAAYRDVRLVALHGPSDLDAFVAELAGFPLESSPGDAWIYSVATDVVGAIVQRVADMPLADFLHARILDPLGMVDTGFHVPAEKQARLGDCWAIDGKGALAIHDPAEGGLWTRPPTFVSGGGGLVSTTADYHRFARMLLGQGELEGTRLVSPKTIQLMTANHLPGGQDLTRMSRSLFSEATNAGTGFGLGVAVTGDVAASMMPGSPGTFYWGGMFSTFFFVDPVERITMVLMTQLMPSSAWPIRRQLMTMIYAALVRSEM